MSPLSITDGRVTRTVFLPGETPPSRADATKPTEQPKITLAPANPPDQHKHRNPHPKPGVAPRIKTIAYATAAVAFGGTCGMGAELAMVRGWLVLAIGLLGALVVAVIAGVRS
jgi:hypothetical protein